VVRVLSRSRRGKLGTAPALGHRHAEPFDYEERYWDRREAA